MTCKKVRIRRKNIAFPCGFYPIYSIGDWDNFLCRFIGQSIAMGTGTRGASAALSRRVKQEVVRLLFGPSLAGKGPDAHRKLDHSIYTYDQLRKAYLERVHALHPDKNAHRRNVQSTTNKNDSKEQFVEIQEAWAKYEEVARMMKTVENGAPEANFTLFGVGCSFSDSDAERAWRAEITDQASRGWFTSGLLADSVTSHAAIASKVPRHNRNTAGTTISLCDDDLFVQAADTKQRNHSEKGSPRRGRTSLVSGVSFMGR
jgi:hypothetical protein